MCGSTPGGIGRVSIREQERAVFRIERGNWRPIAQVRGGLHDIRVAIEPGELILRRAASVDDRADGVGPQQRQQLRREAFIGGIGQEVGCRATCIEERGGNA